jgi:hypothetical protein
MRNKKGSHVGMMLSFVIFITFIVFMLTTFDPLVRSGKNEKYLFEQLERALLEKFKTDGDVLIVNIQSVKGEYETNYDDLKDELKLPENVNFWFKFADVDTGVDIEPQEILEGTNVYVKDVFVLYKDPGMKGGFLTMKIW